MKKSLLALLSLLVFTSMVLAACGDKPAAQPSVPGAENAHDDFLPTLNLGETNAEPTTSEGLPLVVLIAQTTPTPNWVDQGANLVQITQGENTIVEGSDKKAGKEEFYYKTGWFVPVKDHGFCPLVTNTQFENWVEIDNCKEEEQ